MSKNANGNKYKNPKMIKLLCACDAIKKSRIWKAIIPRVNLIILVFVSLLSNLLFIKIIKEKNIRTIGWKIWAILWLPAAISKFFLVLAYSSSSFGKSSSPKYLWLESKLKFLFSVKKSENKYSFFSKLTVVIPGPSIKRFLYWILPFKSISFGLLFSLTK